MDRIPMSLPIRSRLAPDAKQLRNTKVLLALSIAQDVVIDTVV